MEKIDFERNNSITIKRKIMSNPLNIKKSLYIARPKKTENVYSREQEIIYTNKLTGKPYIAYPKNSLNNPKPVPLDFEFQEGLYVAYPREDNAADKGENIYLRMYVSENNFGLPEQPGWSTKKGYSLSIYNSLSKNKWSINTFCQLFKAKVL